MGKEFVPQLRLDTPGSADDEVTPEITSDGDQGHDAYHQQSGHQDIGHHIAATGDHIHRPFYETGNKNLRGVHHHEKKDAKSVEETVLFQIWKDGSVFF